MKPVRKIKPECVTCRFFSGSEEESRLSHNDRLVEFGICRRYAPRPQQGPDVEWCSFPFVMQDDWCGEWESKRGSK